MAFAWQSWSLPRSARPRQYFQRVRGAHPGPDGRLHLPTRALHDQLPDASGRRIQEKAGPAQRRLAIGRQVSEWTARPRAPVTVPRREPSGASAGRGCGGPVTSNLTGLRSRVPLGALPSSDAMGTPTRSRHCGIHPRTRQLGPDLPVLPEIPRMSGPPPPIPREAHQLLERARWARVMLGFMVGKPNGRRQESPQPGDAGFSIASINAPKPSSATSP